MAGFVRNKGKEVEGVIFRWDLKNHDVAIEIVRKGKVYDVLEVVGGYVEHELEEGLESIDEAREKAIEYMKEMDDEPEEKWRLEVDGVKELSEQQRIEIATEILFGENTGEVKCYE